MSMPQEQQFKEAVDNYGEVRANIEEFRSRSAEVSVTVIAPRRVVSVTVGQQGRITDLSFPTSAYKRMAPADLANAVMESVREAQEKAEGEVTELLSPLLPEGVSASAVVDGTIDVSTFLPPDLDITAPERATDAGGGR